MTKQIITAALFVLAFAIGNQTSAQTKDSGIYTVYVGDLVLAEEIYARETLAGGAVKTVSKVAATTFVTTVKNDKPFEFTIETNGTQVLKTVFATGEAKTLIAGQPEKTINTGTSVILENSVWSQYANLLAQYDRKKSGAQNFVGFLPSQAYEFSLTLEKSATKDFKLNGQTVALDKYKLVNTNKKFSRGFSRMTRIGSKADLIFLRFYPRHPRKSAVKNNFNFVLLLNTEMYINLELQGAVW